MTRLRMMAIALVLVLAAAGCRGASSASISVEELSDTSAVLVMRNAPEGGGYTWALSPCRALPEDGRAQLLGLTPGMEYTATLWADAECQEDLDSVRFRALVRTPATTSTPQSDSEILSELIRAVGIDDGVYAVAPPSIDWDSNISLDVMEQAIQHWYEDRKVHPYLEFDCEQRESPSRAVGCYGTQDELGDEIVAFSYMYQEPISGIIVVQHEYAHQTDFQVPARYVIYKAAFGMDYKVSVILDVRMPGGFDRVERTYTGWRDSP